MTKLLKNIPLVIFVVAMAAKADVDNKSLDDYLKESEQGSGHTILYPPRKPSK